MPCSSIHLATTDYPIYCIKSINSRYFIVAGGGGCSKTGVDNSLALYEIGLDSYHIFGKIVSLINMGLYAPMNIAYKSINDCMGEYFLALGIGDMCQTFNLKKVVEKRLIENISSCSTTTDTLIHNTRARHRTSDHSLTNADIDINLPNGIDHKSSSHQKSSDTNTNISSSYTKDNGDGLKSPLNTVSKKNGYISHSKTQKKDIITNEYLKEAANNKLLPKVKGQKESLTFSDSSSLDTKNTQKLDNISEHTYDLVSDFKLEPLHSVKSDTISLTGHQKAVKICANRGLIITGATDGHIRVWKMEQMTKILDIKAHSNEIDDVEIHPTKPHIISASRDGHAYAWNLINGTKICELEWNIGQHYRFRSCRYSRINPTRVSSTSPEETKLFTIHIPCRRSKVRQSCYLTKWHLNDGTNTYDQESTKITGIEEPYILSLEKNGRFLAIGTSGGSVSVYTTCNLNRISHFPNAHDIFITGLDFIATPVRPKERFRGIITSSNDTAGDKEEKEEDIEHQNGTQLDHDAALINPPYFAGADACLLSISVDRHIRMYRVYHPRPANSYFLVATIFFLLLIFMAYSSC